MLQNGDLAATTAVASNPAANAGLGAAVASVDSLVVQSLSLKWNF